MTLARFSMAIQLIVEKSVTCNRIFLRKCARWSILTGTGSRLNGSEDTPYFLINRNEWRL
jgi:hypothetical protein